MNEWIEIAALARPGLIGGMIGESAAMRAVAARIERLAPYKSTVLIQGESGVGKELVAQALHRYSTAAKGPLVSFNCSTLVEGLAEAQLFGHIRGAYTDAREASLGCFRNADGGTLFLDEIGELPIHMQPKLLRVTETLEVQPVGSATAFRVDVRLVAATNRDLLQMVKAGRFRGDLYYRLAAETIRVAPLRERREDIAPLTAHFVEDYCRESGRQIHYISSRALRLLHQHDWPGNVRELAHALERAVLFSESDRIDCGDLSAELLENLPETAAADDTASANAETETALLSSELNENTRTGLSSLDLATKRAVVRSLAEAKGNCADAARLLGISRPAIYRKMARFGLRRTDAST